MDIKVENFGMAEGKWVSREFHKATLIRGKEILTGVLEPRPYRHHQDERTNVSDFLPGLEKYNESDGSLMPSSSIHGHGFGE